MKDPVVHDHALNEAFRSEIPRKPEPTSDSVKLNWVEVVPKFNRVRGVQVTKENLDDIARLHGYDVFTPTTDSGDHTSYLIVPGTTGDVRAFINDWILVADNNWDLVTVCSAAAFTRNYEVET